MHADRRVLPQRLGERFRLPAERAPPHGPPGLTHVQRLGDRTDDDALLDPRLLPQGVHPGDLGGQPVPGIALRQPPVPAHGGPAGGGGRGAAHPDRHPLLDRPGQLPEPAEREPLPRELRVLLRPERGPQRVDRLVQHPPAPVEVRPDRLELLPHVPGPDPEDQPPATEVVEGGVLLGGDERMAQPDDGDMAHEQHALGDPGEKGERGDRVVPDGAHALRQPTRDRDVVAAGDVGEPAAIGGAGDADEIGGGRRRLPGFRVDGALRLDRQLHPVRRRPIGRYRHGGLLPLRPGTVPPRATAAIVIPDGPSDKGWGDIRVRRRRTPMSFAAGRGHPYARERHDRRGHPARGDT